jgi:hypothetical protein
MTPSACKVGNIVAQRPVFLMFCVPGTIAPGRCSDTFHPILQGHYVHVPFIGQGSDCAAPALTDLRQRLLFELDRTGLFRLQPALQITKNSAATM